MNKMLRAITSWQIDAAGALVCVVLTLGAVAMFRQTAPVADQAGPHVAQLGQQQQLAQQYAERLKRVHRSIDEAQTEANQTSGRLTSLDHLNRRVDDMARTLKELGLTTEELRSSDVASHGELVTVPLHVAGRARYEDWQAFVRALHESFPDMRVAGFVVTAPAPGQEELTFRFDIVWYALQASRQEQAFLQALERDRS